MRLPRTDVIATILVAVAVLLYLVWALDATAPGLDSTRATGAVVLGLGFAASAVAVVPGFDGLMHGNRAYLAVTSLIGLAAFVAGVVMLVAASGPALTVLMGTMVVLWAIATTHHVLLARHEPSAARIAAEQARHRPGTAH